MQSRYRYIPVVLAVAILVLSGGINLGNARQEQPQAPASPEQLQKQRRLPATSVAMPSHSITVRANGDNGLSGRRIVIRLAKGRHSQSRTVALNGAGDASVRFELGSVPVTAHGAYRVTIVKAAGDPSGYGSSANYCFDGTSPGSRSVTVDSGHRNVSADFTINASIAWNRQGFCW